MKAKDKLKIWMEKNIPEKKTYSSILFEHKDEIEELYVNGYTQKQILQFLNEIFGIKTTRQNLDGFINRHINKEEAIKQTGQKKPEKKDKFSELDKKYSHLL